MAVNVSQTCQERNARNWARKPSTGVRSEWPVAVGCRVSPAPSGTKAAIPPSASTPIAVTAQKATLQPQRSPTSAPKGTPSTFASVSPANMTATARDFFSGATRLRATSEPIPKNDPWHNAATIRPSNITG